MQPDTEAARGFTTEERPLPWGRARKAANAPVLHLVLAWSLDEPDRVGEALAIDAPICVGRGEPSPDDPARRRTLVRMRPGANEVMGPVASARIGRVQLVIVPRSLDVALVRSMFAQKLCAIVDHLSETDWLARELRKLRDAHERYGVTDEMYPWVTDALIDTLREALGPRFTQDLERNWREAYALLLSATLLSRSAGT